ncbi:hypothetical protein DPSP01_013745 [Paraphaeosphaeria sporulosa]
MRDRYTGVDKRLMEEMQRGAKFMMLLERAGSEVRKVVQDVVETEEGVTRNLSEEREGYDGRSGRDAIGPSEHSGLVTDIDALDPAAGHSEDEDADAETYMHVIRISAFCAAGQHRSVAFACALASCDWPREWTVRAEHLDLGLKKEDRRRGGKGRERCGEKWWKGSQ